MTGLLVEASAPARPNGGARSASRAALAAAVVGFFVVTIVAVVVNVALPSIRADLGCGISGLQWVVDGYTLMFAALLLAAGAFSDRSGARCSPPVSSCSSSRRRRAVSPQGSGHWSRRVSCRDPRRR